jgi:hypothetical protein
MLHLRFRARLLEEGIMEDFLSVIKLMTMRIAFIIFRRIRINNEKPLLSFVMSNCPSLSAFISGAPTGRIFMKFDIGDFYENLWRNSNFR